MRRVSFREIIFRSLSCTLALSLTVPIVSSSGNQNNYNVYNYDQTTPQFTPDGRLLQVEYASSAADLSPPLVVVEFASPRSTSSVASSSISKNGDDHESSLSYPCTVLITIPKQPSSPQNRIIIIESKESVDERNKIPRDTSFCLAMSGILADSLALIQAGMKVAAEYSLRYQDSLDMESLVQTLADECQSRVFAGGLRPYGSNLLLCGYDHRGRNSFESLIYQTDPSGGILRQRGRYSEERQKSKSKTMIPKKKHPRRQGDPISNNLVQGQVRCIVGGTSGLQRQLYKQINQGMLKFEQQQQQRNFKEKPLSLADRIANVARILIKETEYKRNDAGNSRDKSRNSKENSCLTHDCRLEIVVVSPLLGCHRLEGKQLHAIKDLMNAERK